MFSRLASRTIRSGKRFMGSSHGHEEVHREGFDKLVRGIFKEDHELAIGVIGLYGSLILIAKLWPSKKKAVVDAPVVVASSSDSEIPSVDSPAFDAWANTEGNIEKFFSKLA